MRGRLQCCFCVHWPLPRAWSRRWRSPPALARATPITTKEGVLPPGTELNEEPLDQPNELFYSELAGGKRSYLLNLGDLLFSSPAILGGVARQAGISCETCHQQGHNNAKLFIPGLSKPARHLRRQRAAVQPQGRQRRVRCGHAAEPARRQISRALCAMTAGFRRCAISSATPSSMNSPGREPSAQVLDALETYIKEIAFLPNPKLGAGGRLTNEASDAARRGEALFNKPFRHDAAMSCAACHKPDAAFVDHQMHDVGTGGWFKTPTLINANFNAPYFHDGRFDSYAQVVGYFDRHFDLGLSDNERADLVAYLDAVGDAEEPTVRNTVQAELDEIAAIRQRAGYRDPRAQQGRHRLDRRCGRQRMARTGGELSGRPRTPASAAAWPSGGARAARRKDMVLTLRQIAMAADADDFAGAAQAYADYREQVARRPAEAEARGALVAV